MQFNIKKLRVMSLAQDGGLKDEELVGSRN